MLSRITKRKFKAMCFYMLSWLLGCFAFILLYYFGTPNVFSFSFYLYIIQFSIFTGLSQGIYDILILQDDKDHRSVIPSLLIRSLYLSLTIVINISLCVFIEHLYSTGSLISENSLTALCQHWSENSTRAFAIYSFLLGYLITFIRSVHKKFGTRVLINTVLGKYQEPTEEERVFMFVDLRQSTALAEELGNFKYSSFLRDYYHYLSNCCEENHGEIYQIVGDGVVLSWAMKKCIKKPRPIFCFEDLILCFQRLAPYFQKKYGRIPSFRAAAHCGKVIVSEVGNFGSAMAYHGDAVNTTARLQTLCSQNNYEFLISEELLLKLKKMEKYHPENKGIMELKGKKRNIFAYTLDFSLDNRKNIS